jgi:hypothetical protein
MALFGGKRSKAIPSSPSAKALKNMAKSNAEFLRAIKVDRTVKISHSDAESMLSGIGVIAALILSLQVGVFFTIGMDELLIAEYRMALIEESSFRAFAHSVMVQEQIPLIYDIGGDMGLFNATHALVGMPAEDYCIPYMDGGYSDCWYFHEGTDAVDKVFHLTKDVFPKGKITPWMMATKMHPDRSFTNRLMGFWSELSMYCLMMTLLGSILFYTALALSECREGEVIGDDLPTIWFNKIAVPVLLCGYVLLILGIVSFYFAITWVQIIRAPQFWVTTAWSYYNWGRTIPTFLLLCVLALISLIMSNNYKYLEKKRKAWNVLRGVADNLVHPQNEEQQMRLHENDEEEHGGDHQGGGPG